MSSEQQLTKEKLLRFLERLGAGAPPPLPEHALFDLLTAEHGPEAYRYYRSLMRRLVSLEQAMELQAAGGRPWRIEPTARSGSVPREGA